MTPSSVSIQLTIPEARQQLREAESEAQRVRARIEELHAQGGPEHLSAAAKAAAQRLMDGDSPDQVVLPTLTSASLRRAISSLEGLYAEKADQVVQARSALRLARLRKLDMLLDQARIDYDKAAAELLEKFATTTVLADRVAQARGVNPMHLGTWYRIVIPRALPLVTTDPYEMMRGHCSDGQEAMSGRWGNKARSEIQVMLKTEDVE